MPYGGVSMPPRPPALPPPPSAPISRQEREREQRASAAWGAYKSADGSVYYYNALTEQSSWQRPQGFTGDEGKASSNPVPVSSGAAPGQGWGFDTPAEEGACCPCC